MRRPNLGCIRCSIFVNFAEQKASCFFSNELDFEQGQEAGSCLLESRDYGPFPSSQFSASAAPSWTGIYVFHKNRTSAAGNRSRAVICVKEKTSSLRLYTADTLLLSGGLHRNIISITEPAEGSRMSQKE